MAREGIVKEKYTSDEISENIEGLAEEGIIDPEGGKKEIAKVAREFYFRGLVHGHAEDENSEQYRYSVLPSWWV